MEPLAAVRCAAEYRTKANLHAWGSYTAFCPVGVCLDVLDGFEKSWVVLGNAYFDLGETHRAIQFYEQQLAIVREIGDRRGEGIALWNMSLVLDHLGERAQAIQHAEQALTIFEQIEHHYAARVRAKLAAWREQTNT